MVSFSKTAVASTAALLASANAFTPPKATTTTSSAVAPPKAVSIPVDLPQKTWDRTSNNDDVQLDDKDEWIRNLDYDAFAKDVTGLGKELQKSAGQADVDHLNKILDWRNLACAIGVATMWLDPNPITIAALSTWTYASWTMVAHHTCHGGYNRVDAGKYNSRGFALGSIPRRIADWYVSIGQCNNWTIIDHFFIIFC